MKRFIPILLLLISGSAYAELHKWVDAAGNVHYSDTAPPADARKQQVIQQAPANQGGTSASSPDKSIFEREADLDKALKEKREAEQKEAQKQKAAETRRQNCENSRNALRSLENAPRITTFDASGNQTIMDEAARQKKIEEVRKDVDGFCN